MTKVHIPRWLFASVTKHFDNALSAYNVFIEGQPRTALKDKVDTIEIRMDGPYLTEMTKNHFYLTVEINILIQCIKNDKDYHKIHRLAGVVLNEFKYGIPIYKYGDGVDDTGEQIGCLERMEVPGDKRDRIQVNHFGQIDPKVPIDQSSVEGHYRMDLMIEE